MTVAAKIDVSREAYNSPVIVNDEIFVLYSGAYDTGTGDYMKEHILVYDMEGKPLRRYRLSEKIFCIEIDAKNKIIYGITDSPEFHLLKFNYQII
jgi:hypothetical protein